MTDVSLLFLVHEIVVEVRVKEEGLQKVLRRYLSSMLCSENGREVFK